MPAWPSRVTKSISGFMSRFMAKFCSRLRGGDPPHGVLGMGVVDQGFQHRRLARRLLSRWRRSRRSPARRIVDQEIGAEGPLDPVKGLGLLLPGFHAPGRACPRSWRAGAGAGVEDVGILEHLVVEVVLRRQAQERALMRMLMSLDTRDERLGCLR